MGANLQADRANKLWASPAMPPADDRPSNARATVNRCCPASSASDREELHSTDVMGRKCICQICTCGNHKCRHKTPEGKCGATGNGVIDGHHDNEDELLEEEEESVRQRRRQWETSPDRLVAICESYPTPDKENLSVADTESVLAPSPQPSEVSTIRNETRDPLKVIHHSKLHRNNILLGTDPPDNVSTYSLHYSEKLPVNTDQQGSKPQFAASSTAFGGSVATEQIGKTNSKKKNMRIDLENRNRTFGGSLTLNGLVEEPDPLESTTHDEYVNWKVPKTPSAKPKENLKLEGDVNYQSITKSDYAQEKVGLDEDLRSEITVKPEGTWKLEGDMDFETTAGLDYTAKQAEKVVQKKPQSALRDLNRTVVVHPYVSDETITHDTTNMRAYQPYQGHRYEVNVPKETLRSEGLMDFTTTAGSEYQGGRGEKASLLRPKTSLQLSGTSDMSTINKETYREQSSVPERAKAIKPLEISHTHNEPFLETTTLRSDYPSWKIEKPNREKPRDNLKADGEFLYKHISTTRADFDNRAVSPELLRILKDRKPFPTDNLRLEGVMEFNPETASEYVSRQIEGPVLKLPKESRNTSHWQEAENASTPFEVLSTKNPPFQVLSTTNVGMYDYDAGKEIRSPPIKPSPNLKLEGSLDLNSTTRLEFSGRPCERAAMLRPATSMKCRGTIDFQTTNQEHYKGLSNPTKVGKQHEEPKKVSKVSIRVSDADSPKEMVPMKTQIPKLIPESRTDYTTTNQQDFSSRVLEKSTKTKAPQDSIYNYMDHKELADWPRKTKIVKTKFGKSPQLAPREEMISTSQASYTPKYLSQDTNQLKDNNSMRELFISKMKQESDHPYDYVQRGVNNNKPSTTLKMEGEHDFLTTSNKEFITKDFTKTKSLRPKSSFILQDGAEKVENLSLARDSFRGLKAEKAKVLPMKIPLKLTEGDFVGETTLNSDYLKWEGMPRTRITKPSTSLKAEGRMLLDSTTKSDFDGKAGAKNKICRPKSSLRHTGKHDLKTTNQEVYGKTAEKEDKRRKHMAENRELEKKEQKLAQERANEKTNVNANKITSFLPAEPKLQESISVPQPNRISPIPIESSKTEPNILENKGPKSLSPAKVIPQEPILAATRSMERPPLPPQKLGLVLEKKIPEPVRKQLDRKSPERPSNIPEIKINERQRQETKPSKRISMESKNLERLPAQIATAQDPAALAPPIEGKPKVQALKHKKDRIVDYATEKHRNNRYKCSLKASGPMEFTTTTGSAFADKDLRRTKSDSSVCGPAGVPGLWASKKYSLTSQGSLKQHMSTLQLTGGIDFTTTNRQCYRPSSKTSLYTAITSHQAKMNRPKSNGIFRAKEPFYGHTTYRQHYGPDNGHKCPAERLNSQTSRFSFKEEVNGHKFYMPVVQS